MFFKYINFWNFVKSDFFKNDTSSSSSWGWLTKEQEEKLSRVDFETYNETETYNNWDSVLHNWKYYIININGFTGTFNTDNASEVGNVYEVFLEKIWELVNLETTDKTKIVNAINELKSLIDDVDITWIIDDSSETGTEITYSIDKIRSLIDDSEQWLLDWVEESYNTLNKIAGELQRRLAVNQEQNFTDEEKQQARDNINIYSKQETDTKLAEKQDTVYVKIWVEDIEQEDTTLYTLLDLVKDKNGIDYQLREVGGVNTFVAISWNSSSESSSENTETTSDENWVVEYSYNVVYPVNVFAGEPTELDEIEEMDELDELNDIEPLQTVEELGVLPVNDLEPIPELEPLDEI